MLLYILRITHKLCSVLHFKGSLVLWIRWDTPTVGSSPCSLVFAVTHMKATLGTEVWTHKWWRRECASWKSSVLFPFLNTERIKKIFVLFFPDLWSVTRMSGIPVAFLAIKRAIHNIFATCKTTGTFVLYKQRWLLRQF